MSVVAAAVIGSTVVGAVSSKNAADKASSATKAGIKQTGALAEQSRNDAMTLYNQGRKSAQTGLASAFDFYKKASPARYQPMVLGNVAAQKAIGQGAVQANNAILGRPVDMSFTNPQQIPVDMSAIQNAQLPAMDQNLAVGGLMAQPAPVAAGTESYYRGLGRQAVK